MPNVDDHGLEVLKKAARNIGATPKSDYALQVIVVSEDGVSTGDGIVKAKKQCDSVISALRICKATSANTISYASNLDDILDAQSLCLSLQSGVAMSQIDVALFGQVNDGFFNFPLNAPLYLGDDGQVLGVPPLSGHLVNIGHSLGTGAILLNFKAPLIRA
jgi:hypothetical protein